MLYIVGYILRRLSMAKFLLIYRNICFTVIKCVYIQCCNGFYTSIKGG